MDSNNNEGSNSNTEIVNKFVFFNVLNDGTIKFKYPHKIGNQNQIPPPNHPINGVQIKDVQISPTLSARLFLPQQHLTNTKKLPLLLYIHGGGFCMESAFSPTYTTYLTHLVSQAKVIAVSVEYGLFPKSPIPACYDDSWAALLWVGSHVEGSGPESWINEHADLERVFVGGDSAGGNISHTVLVRAGVNGLPRGVKVEGMILVHPFFRCDREDDDMWMYMCPENGGLNDRRLKPDMEDLRGIGCLRVLVVVAEEDYLVVAGRRYVEELVKSGWEGKVEIIENKGRKHCFHLFDFDDFEAGVNMQRICEFINGH